MSQLSYWKVLTRRKTLTYDTETDTKLNRILTTYDLTALGVGATLGVGVYVLAGHVAKEQAGPSVVISFAIAAMASLLAGLCYAEFGARVPKAGSAYIYSYVCIGEFAAFIIGWNLILEYIIGSASVCRGISLYLDALINDTLKETFLEVAPIKWGFLATYFDFFAFGLAVTFGVFLSFGFQTSTVLNNCCTLINVGIVIFVIIAGSIKADIKNWEINPENINTTLSKIPPKLGDGGFFPFGFEGTLKGAATCFFGFVGFDCIATTGEEVKEPRRAIPRAILLSLLVIFLSYFGVSTVLTLMWPYYLQNVDAPLPYAFQEIGWPAAKWIVTIGGMLGLVASLFGALFPLPRIIYAMSQDGLVFRFLGTISPKFKAPVVGSICAAFLTGIISGIFELKQLVNMLSIGTLLAYTVVAISITILRFMDNTSSNRRKVDATENSNLMSKNKNRKDFNSVLMQIFNFNRLRIPNDLSTSVVCALILTYCLCCLGISLTIMYAPYELTNGEPWSLTLLGILIIINLIIILAISVQPREENNPYFRVPLVPLIPSISIFVNIYLMLQLDIYTWIRFGIWMTIGLFIYVACYLMNNKKITNNHNNFKSYLTRNIGIDNNGYEFDENITNHMDNNLKFAIHNEIINSNNNSIKSLNSLKKINSLDEIILESELSETIKEMKMSNGKTCFIENDTILNDSINDKLNIDKQIINNGEDDAKSVIAILDDVLQADEDEAEKLTFRDYRKVSVDSEMIPSFVEMSTFAMIHSCSEDDHCFREEEENSSGGSIKGINKEPMVLVQIIEPNLNDTEHCDRNDDGDVDSIAAVNVTMAGKELRKNSYSDDEIIPGIILQKTFTPRHSVNTEIPKIEIEQFYNLNDNKLNESIEPIENNVINEHDKELPVPLINDDKAILSDSGEERTTENSSLEHPENEKSIAENSPEINLPPPPPLPPLPAKQLPTEKAFFSIVPLKKPISPIQVRQRRSSTSSISSNSSADKADDSNRFENFKEKLSRLMARPPPLKIPKKFDDLPPEKFENDKPKTAPADTQSSPLKISKSEADIEQLALESYLDPLDNNENNQNDSNNNKRTSQILKKLEKSDDSIPKPPKFDAILYKSLGAKTYNQIKERPKLDELVGNGGIKLIKRPKTPDDKLPQETTEPQHFKEKLAALLKRGPSYRIQKQLLPSDVSPRISLINQNPTELKSDHYLEVLKTIRENKNNFVKTNESDDKIKRFSKTNNESLVELDEVRKKLRPLVM